MKHRHATAGRGQRSKFGRKQIAAKRLAWKGTQAQNRAIALCRPYVPDGGVNGVVVTTVRLVATLAALSASHPGQFGRVLTQRGDCHYWKQTYIEWPAEPTSEG